MVVSADDFGLTSGMNAGVMESVAAGCVSSVSLCVNGTAFEEALALIRKNPGLDVGLHIVLVGERPVSAPERIKSLVDKEGNFHKDAFTFLRRYLLGRINAQEIESEISAQFQKAGDAGLNISHVDSHQHLHMLPGILEIIIRMCERYRISFIRTARCPIVRHWRFAGKKKISVQLALNILSALARNKINSCGLRTVDVSSGTLYSGALNEERFLAFVSSFENGVAEIICHPALVDAFISERYGNWHYDWDGERRFLVSDKPGAYMKSNEVILTDFSSLANRF